MSDELVVAERALPQRQSDFFSLGPKNMVEQATEIANVLSNIIETQKLYTFFKQKKHIQVEGWQTLGTILGILPKEKRVTEYPDGSFEAEMELINMKTGIVVGGASSYCGMDEPNWNTKPKFSRRSMAITRATGKAYRGAFGWIVTLAGYSATPAEEMDGVDVHVQPSQKTAPKPQAQRQEKAEKPVVFSSKDADETKKLEGFLKREGVLPELWQEIIKRLDGKEKTQAKEIVKAVVEESKALDEAFS